MRLLNSICKVIASSYHGIPVHIEEVPKDFRRDCFLVTLATESSKHKNFNVYEDTPLFQIVYFGKRNEANQVLAENLYKVKEELKALFFLRKAVPVIPLEGVAEKSRYAKLESYSDEVRLDEGALYVKLTLSFTEDTPNVDPNGYSEPYEDIGVVDIVTEVRTNG